MKLNKEKIKERISEIKESTIEIEKLTSMDEREFWKEKRNIAAVKYYLLQAIESIGSICVHIIAKKFGKGVYTISECFVILEKGVIINKDLYTRLKKMVKFRNKLVHRYWEIDDKLVYNYAKNDIKDFLDFINEIYKIIL